MYLLSHQKGCLLCSDQLYGERGSGALTRNLRARLSAALFVFVFATMHSLPRRIMLAMDTCTSSSYDVDAPERCG